MQLLNKIKEFWSRQSRNWKVIIARNGIGTLFTGVEQGGGGPMLDVGATGGGQYWTVFMNRLGLSTVEIGLLRGISSAVTILLALPFGWLTDHTKKMKKLYLGGRAAALPVALIRYLARTWPFCVLISVWETISIRIMDPPSQIIMIDSISNKDRVAGLSITRTVMGIAGIMGPLIIALIINHFGGLDYADSIRPLFLIQFVVGLFVMVLLVTQMQEVIVTREKQKVSTLSQFFDVFKEVPVLKLLLLRQIINTFFMNIGMPSLTLYMVDVKGADEFILGWRGTARTAFLVSASLPIGRLADRVGRVRITSLGCVFGLVGTLIMILTPSSHPEYLIVAGLIESVRMVMLMAWMAFDQELVPLASRGRYSGATMIITGVVGVVAPIVGGLIWELNPDLIWWIRLIGQALIILPLTIIIGYKAKN